MRRPRISAVLVCTTVMVGLTACSSGDDGGETGDTTTASGVPHGYVEGAEEAAEPQLRLASFDSGEGTLTLTDLLTGNRVSETPAAGPAGADGRYLFLREDSAVTVFDSGVWSVDHGDHFHYYRSDPSEVATVDEHKPGHVISADSRVAFFDDGTGDVAVYSRAELEKGSPAPVTTFTVGAHHGVAVPFEDAVLSTTAPDNGDELPGTLTALDSEGHRTDIAGDTACPGIHGAATTRDAALFTCADGILTVSADGDSLSSSLTPYPAQAKGRAYSLASGRSLVAAPLEDGGMALFDPETTTWTLVDTSAPVASVAVSTDDRTVLAVDGKGTGYAVDPGTGKVLASTKVAGGGDGTSVVLSPERGYVSDPGSGTVTELDVNDGLRETRTFQLGGAPGTLALVGGK